MKHLKSVYSLLSLVLVLTSSFISPLHYNTDNILGTYSSPNKKSKIEFIEKDGFYYGILKWNENLEIKDQYNHNKTRRSEKLIGKTIFQKLKYNKYDHSWTGKFYDADSGNTYDCNLWLENSKNNLMAKGYVHNPMFGKTEMLKRVTL